MKSSNQRRPKRRLTLQGAELDEAWRLAADLDAFQTDTLLLLAARCSKRARASVLSQSELRTVAYFAMMPEFGHPQQKRKTRYRLMESFQDHGNLMASEFLLVWMRQPDAVLRLITAIRRAWNDPGERAKLKEFKEHASKLPPAGISKKANALRQRIKSARKLTRPPEHIRQFADALREVWRQLAGDRKKYDRIVIPCSRFTDDDSRPHNGGA